ncbi:hypothetical protein LZ318_30725 [Saccharopolyspora indica]|uniref:hypothetical protein n=1 Tax=Saccharopolyspora indica TaxID=1229659 RepID=UPI0022EA5CA6|nr:hypothetical protein [Saccharopolyspora indica]MDA3644393.1 hypothetical protein [Saccharopolyspora indica]
MSDEDITPTPRRGDQHENELERQISALTEVVGALASKVNKLRARLEAVENGHPGSSDGDSERTGAKEHDRPAPWVMFSPPAAAEDRLHHTDNHTPLWTIENFVAWYNLTYVGVAGGPAKPIPSCWRDHEGLPMEIGTLAYSWRAANIGRSANVRDAQYWHDAWRPRFTTRLLDWVHPHCLDGRHRDTGAPPRPDRFTPPST